MPLYFYNGLPLFRNGGWAANSNCCCSNCCCGVFAVNLNRAPGDFATYYGSTPVNLYVTFGGDLTGTAVLTRFPEGTEPTDSSVCIEYRLKLADYPLEIAYADIVGCPSDEVFDRRIANTIRLRCFAGAEGQKTLELYWAGGGDGGSYNGGYPSIWDVTCDPFSAVGTHTLVYIIPSSCDGAASRTATLTITL